MFGRLRRRVIFVPLLIVVVASISGGVVAAQALTDGGGSPRGKLLDRAAEILDIDPDALADAFEQAGADLADEKVDELLADLVANGRLTDDESAEIRAWLDARPESLGTIGAATLRELIDGEGPNFRSVLRIGRPAISAAVLQGDLTQEQANVINGWLDEFPETLLDVGIPEAIEFYRAMVERNSTDQKPLTPNIDGLVEAGIITQEQANAFEAWWDGRPDEVNGLIPGPLHFGLPFAEKFFFDGETDGLRILPDLFRGFGDPGERFRLDRFHPPVDRDGVEPRTFDFDFFGPDGFGFGNGLPFDLPELRGLDEEGLGDLRERFEERFRNFDGDGRFEFRFGDGEPFHFEFPAPDDNDGDADSDEISI